IIAAYAAGQKATAAPAAAAAAAPAAPAAAPAAQAPADAAKSAEAAQERIFAILDSDEAKERPALARTLAKNVKLSVDEAKAILAASAVETPAAAGEEEQLAAAFDKQMQKRGNSGGVKPNAK